jgi:glycosyltransferase involved in cell wall biosynthesis
MFHPLVSIVIPVYNGANFLRESIDSALAQTYSSIEVLVINDGSTDETEQIALSYGDKIRYFSKKNGGAASALNLGIQNMRGEYFSWLSHDDKYFSHKIVIQIEKLSNLANKTDIVFCSWMVVDENGQEIHKVLPLEKYTIEKLETPLFALLHGQIGGCGLLIHRDHFNRVGLFREDLPTTQDFDMWFRIMRNSPCRFCEDVLYMTRIHNGQMSKTKQEAHAQESDILWIQMMEILSDYEKIQLDGTVRAFYRNVYLHLLVYTANCGAIRYARHQAAMSSSFPTRIYEILLYLSGFGILAGEFLIAIKRQNLGIALKRVYYGIRRITRWYR